MGKQLVNQVRVDSQPFTGDGQVLTFSLPRQYDVERYTMFLSGIFNITTAATALKNGGIASYIRRIELIASGQTVLRSITGTELVALAAYMHKFDMNASPAYRTQPGIGVAAQPFNLMIPLDLAFPDMLKPKDTNLRASKLATLELRVTLGSFVDVLTGGVNASSAGTILVTADNILELEDSQKMISAPPFLGKITQIEIPTTTANGNFLQRLPIGNTVRLIMLTQKVNGEIVDPTTKLLNSAIVVRGTDVRTLLPFLQARAQYARVANLAPASIIPHGVIDYMTRATHQRGKISDGFRVDGAMDLNLQLDFPATAGGTIVVTIVEFLGASVRA